MRLPGLVCTLLFLLLAAPAGAQRVETGFLNRTITEGAQTYRYQVYVPAEYASKPSWPVVLFLHGAGERGVDGLRQTTVGLGPAIRQAPDRFPAVIVFPQAPPDTQWVGAPAEMALAALKQSIREFNGDPDRVYLTGLSMGGHGTWYLAYRHAELFAAIAPICGWVRDEDLPRFRGSDPVVPADAGEALPALARRLARLPTWIFHGEMDGTVPVSASREAANALKAASADVRYTEHLGLSHNSWDATYASDEFVRWLFAQKRR